MKMKASLPSIGTPRTLDEAIQHAICIGPVNEMRERSYHVLRDFLAQKFGVAYMELAQDPAALAVVEKLFAQLTTRSMPAENSGLKSV